MTTNPAFKPQTIDPGKRFKELWSLPYVCRVPSISAGIIHEGRVVLTQNYCFRALREPDVDAGSKTVPQTEGEVVTNGNRAAPRVEYRDLLTHLSVAASLFKYADLNCFRALPLSTYLKSPLLNRHQCHQCHQCQSTRYDGTACPKRSDLCPGRPYCRTDAAWLALPQCRESGST